MKSIQRAGFFTTYLKQKQLQEVVKEAALQIGLLFCR